MNLFLTSLEKTYVILNSSSLSSLDSELRTTGVNQFSTGREFTRYHGSDRLVVLRSCDSVSCISSFKILIPVRMETLSDTTLESRIFVIRFIISL